jgi:hypothetical protein
MGRNGDGLVGDLGERHVGEFLERCEGFRRWSSTRLPPQVLVLQEHDGLVPCHRRLVGGDGVHDGRVVGGVRDVERGRDLLHFFVEAVLLVDEGVAVGGGFVAALDRVRLSPARVGDGVSREGFACYHGDGDGYLSAVT